MNTSLVVFVGLGAGGGYACVLARAARDGLSLWTAAARLGLAAAALFTAIAMDHPLTGLLAWSLGFGFAFLVLYRSWT
jgi:hypothetical protein